MSLTNAEKVFATACTAAGMYVTGTTVADYEENLKFMYRAFRGYKYMQPTEFENWMLAGYTSDGLVDLDALGSTFFTDFPGFIIAPENEILFSSGSSSIDLDQTVKGFIIKDWGPFSPSSSVAQLQLPVIGKFISNNPYYFVNGAKHTEAFNNMQGSYAVIWNTTSYTSNNPNTCLIASEDNFEYSIASSNRDYPSPSSNYFSSDSYTYDNKTVYYKYTASNGYNYSPRESPDHLYLNRSATGSAFNNGASFLAYIAIYGGSSTDLTALAMVDTDFSSSTFTAPTGTMLLFEPTAAQLANGFSSADVIPNPEFGDHILTVENMKQALIDYDTNLMGVIDAKIDEALGVILNANY